MKKIKVFFNGERLRDMYPYATKWEVFKWKFMRFVRKLFFVALAGSSVYVAGLIGSEYFPKTIYEVQAEKIVTVEVPVDTTAVVMERIAHCESGGSHYNKKGQVAFNVNTNGTVDIGYYQINSVWGEQATKLGLDLTNEEDNKQMAKWIFENRGTEDWYSSKKCWQK